ncbi:hypothetical protein EDD58_103403 [Hazenella coriacea]|uniref:Uncharacterized protein n=1 Tax=Hazenella coriacea TaxID=1179467 RepID=A0A4R3L7A5_9BACL|nr:hypothetical protein EDD58_103403 [Hazenella coriacea]
MTIRYLTEKQVLRIHHFIMELHGYEDQVGVMSPANVWIQRRGTCGDKVYISKVERDKRD